MNKDRVWNLLRNFDPADVLGLVEVGSTVYLGDTTGQDDLDLMGVHLEDAATVVMRQPKSKQIRTQPDGHRSRVGDIDIIMHPLRKYASLLASGNPSILTGLFSPTVHHDRGWSLVRSLHSSAASQRSGAAFLGYMNQQVERWRGKRGQKNVSRPELVDAYGFDTKYAYHAIRLGIQGCEYLASGHLTLPIPEPARSELVSLRTGGYTEAEALAWAESVMVDLERGLESSPLPSQPNQGALARRVADVYVEHWALTSTGSGMVPSWSRTASS